jgi:chemotaxis protein histidine kinase CheA
MIQSHPGVLQEINMRRILCVAVVLGALSGPAAAGMSEGVAAVTVGDYAKAIAEFQPLAANGDPVAQYQLAKIYLEGRGPADGVAQGIDLMTKAANAGYPEAQAQLGLMYAMGLGVEPNNMKAYDLLSKAVNALPSGMRRTVAEANRDAVVKRMSAGEQAQVAATAKAKPAETTAAATTAAAKKPASETTTTAAATTAKATTTTKSPTTAPAATTPKTVTEAANKSTKAPDAATQATTTQAKATQPTTTQAAATQATTTKTTTEQAAATKAATTQVASAKAPDATPASGAKTAPSGVRIQLISMPSEEAAWGAWKQLSGKYSSHLSGLTPVLEQADLGTKGTFYRVQAGPFTTVAAAQERCTAMKQDGLDCLVVGKP